MTVVSTNRLRVRHDTVTTPRAGVVGMLEVIQSLAGAQDTLSEFLTSLIVAIPALLIIATVGGIFFSSRALGPIDRMTRMAQRIEGGNLQGRLGLVPRDDELGRLASTFDSMLDRLEQAFEHQRQFVADASHELRTPLAIIRSDLDILRRHPRSLGPRRV